MINTAIPQPEKRHIPAADRAPIAGALPFIIRGPFDYLQQAWQQHGDIFRIDLGVTDVIALNHPRHGQYILRDNARNFRKGGNMWTSVRSLFGNGLVVSEGDFWLRQRRGHSFQQHFAPKKVFSSSCGYARANPPGKLYKFLPCCAGCSNFR